MSWPATPLTGVSATRPLNNPVMLPPQGLRLRCSLCLECPPLVTHMAHPQSPGLCSDVTLVTSSLATLPSHSSMHCMMLPYYSHLPPEQSWNGSLTWGGHLICFIHQGALDNSIGQSKQTRNTGLTDGEGRGMETWVSAELGWKPSHRPCEPALRCFAAGP